MKNKDTICPVCEKHYFEFRDDYDNFPVCGWENDGVQRDDENYWGGANSLSVNESKAVYSLMQNETTKDKISTIIEKHKKREETIGLKYLHINYRTVEGEKCFKEFANAHQDFVNDLNKLLAKKR